MKLPSLELVYPTDEDGYYGNFRKLLVKNESVHSAMH